MHRLDHVSSHCEFEETHERAEGVRLLFEEARTELHRHIEQHGCELLEAVPAIIAKWCLQELDGPWLPRPELEHCNNDVAVTGARPRRDAGEA